MDSLKEIAGTVSKLAACLKVEQPQEPKKRKAASYPMDFSTPETEIVFLELSRPEYASLRESVTATDMSDMKLRQALMTKAYPKTQLAGDLVNAALNRVNWPEIFRALGGE